METKSLYKGLFYFKTTLLKNTVSNFFGLKSDNIPRMSKRDPWMCLENASMTSVSSMLKEVQTLASDRLGVKCHLPASPCEQVNLTHWDSVLVKWGYCHIPLQAHSSHQRRPAKWQLILIFFFFSLQGYNPTHDKEYNFQELLKKSQRKKKTKTRF